MTRQTCRAARGLATAIEGLLQARTFGSGEHVEACRDIWPRPWAKAPRRLGPSAYVRSGTSSGVIRTGVVA